MPEVGSNPKAYIGIDPGKSGGLAVIYGKELHAAPMPDTEHEVFRWIRRWCSISFDSFCLIESVHSFPKQGVASSFTFGQGYGFLRGCLTSLAIPFEAVAPRTWQQKMAVGNREKSELKTAWKKRLKGAAERLFPQATITLETADAILLAECCRRSRLGLHQQTIGA